MDTSGLTDGQTKAKMNQFIIRLLAERSSTFKHQHSDGYSDHVVVFVLYIVHAT